MKYFSRQTGLASTLFVLLIASQFVTSCATSQEFKSLRGAFKHLELIEHELLTVIGENWQIKAYPSLVSCGRAKHVQVWIKHEADLAKAPEQEADLAAEVLKKFGAEIARETRTYSGKEVFFVFGRNDSGLNINFSAGEVGGILLLSLSECAKGTTTSAFN